MAGPDKKSTIADNQIGSFTSLDAYIPGVLTWLYNRLSSDASNMYRARFGLGVTDWRVLAFLGVNKRGTSARISKIISLDKAATSRSMQSLKTQGLINADQQKGREIELTLTSKGEEKFREISQVAMRREQALLDGFSEGERIMLTEFLHRMLANLNKVAEIDP